MPAPAPFLCATAWEEEVVQFSSMIDTKMAAASDDTTTATWTAAPASAADTWRGMSVCC